MSIHYSPPPFDPELNAMLTEIGDQLPTSLTPKMIAQMRDAEILDLTDDDFEAAGLERHDKTILTSDNTEIELTVVYPKNYSGSGPGIYWIHGGGMIIGNRWTGAASTFPWILKHNAVMVTAEYRLAPEYPDPVPLQDCYDGLTWMIRNAGELGFDPDSVLLAGGSAGGGLAAGVALMARDFEGPKLLGQMLQYPMIDDRNNTVSSQQIDGIGVWDRVANNTGWSAYLGNRFGTDDVSIYAAPSRATDLSGLPPAFIDCGSAEVFRDEDVAYATRIWECGGIAELHVWPGGFHAFEGFAPDARLSRLMVEARNSWVDNLFG